MSRPLLLDGITIQLVGELLFELGSEPYERHASSELYRGALEDFAYAVVFADTLGRVGSLPERNGVFPGRAVIDYDGGDLFKHTLPEIVGPAVNILGDSGDLEAISADLGLLEETFPGGGIWLHYLRQEAVGALSEEPQPSGNLQPGGRFLFPRHRAIYFQHSELQQAIPKGLTRALVGSLKRQFAHRQNDDLGEFVERALLTHYAISRWYDKNGSGEFQRLPFVTRSRVRFKLIQNASARDGSWQVLRKVAAVKARVLSGVLSIAFARLRTGQRAQIFDQLCDLRPNFRDHRAWLTEIDTYSRPGNIDAARVIHACDALEKLARGGPFMDVIFSGHSSLPSTLLAGVAMPSYPESAYHIFPELHPRELSSKISVIAGSRSQISIVTEPSGSVTQHFQTTVSPVHNEFHAPIQNLALNSKSFSQISRTGIDPSDIARLVADFTRHIAELKLSPDERRQAEAQIAILDRERAGDSDPAIVMEAGNTLRNITEGVIGSLLATAAQPSVWHWVQRTLSGFGAN